MQLTDLETPALILERNVLDRNLARMREHLTELKVALRPHVKTAKSMDVVRRALDRQPGGITVSTLKEAEHFLSHGIEFPVMIEIDSDGHRSGIEPGDTALIDIGTRLHGRRGTALKGVMTHAGDSYNCPSIEAIRAMAERERTAVVCCAEELRRAGLPCPVVSVGSTPTATYAERMDGVTEVRAGVYMFFDLVMAGLGVCTLDDIAVSVMTSVIGHQPDRHWIITDAGWMALSRDRGTAKQRVDQGYGVVCDLGGRPIDDLIVKDTNQEHGIVADRAGGAIDLERFPVGTLLRVLPNHACATSAQHPHYNVIAGEPVVEAVWPRFNGW